MILPHTPSSMKWWRALAAVLVFVGAGFAADGAKRHFDLPADIAARSLKAFAQQAGVEVLIHAELGREIMTRPVRGEMTSREAIVVMLHDTGLMAEIAGRNGVFAIRQVSAGARDRMWTVLSDNAEVDLPRFETGATYACEPKPTDPAELPAAMMASPQGGGLGRLQDAGRPTDPASAALGWRVPSATVTFDLKRTYRVDGVELLLMSGVAPDAIRVECREKQTLAWTPAGGLQHPSGAGNFWQLIVLKTPQRAAEVRLTFESRQERFQVREVRIWGGLDEADPSRMTPIAGDGGSELTLVGGGQAQSVIVVGTQPSLKAVAAARLLQDMLFRMTGAMPPVVEQFARPALPRLLVGPKAAAQAGVTIPQTYPENEQFVLRRIGRDVVIAGNDVSPDPNGDPDLATSGMAPGRGQVPAGFHGTMTAVCAFLEQHGARFFRWDDVARYLVTPRRPDIRIGSLDRVERPAFVRRSISARVQTYTPSRDLWRIWNRIGGVLMAYTHNDLVPPSAYRTHPEYFALIKGQRVEPAPRRPWQVCTTNPEVIRRAGELAAEQFASSPSLRSYSLSARDNTGFCECDSCRSQPGNVSDRWVAFANAVRVDFDRRHPEFGDRKFVFYAYWVLSTPPQHVKLVPGVQAMYIGDGCHAHVWQSPHENCSNHRMLEKLAGWKVASPSEPVLIYDWYIPATGSGTNSLQWQNFPWFTYTKPFVDARFWRQLGTPVVNVEIDGVFEKLALHWLPYYVLARAAWDPSLSADEMLHDLCGSLYGRASGTMENLFRLLDRSLAEADVHAKTWRMPDPHGIYSEGRRQEIAQLLAQAMAQTTDPMARARIDDVAGRWDAGWKALENLKLPAKDVEMYNPAVGK